MRGDVALQPSPCLEKRASQHVALHRLARVVPIHRVHVAVVQPVLRTDAAKRYRKVENATAMLWKLLLVAEKSFRKLDHAEHLRDVLAGRSYENGKLVVNAPKIRRAA